MPQRLLVVEDDPAVRRSLAETLEAEGVEVHLACTAEEALARLAEVAPEVVLTDVRMPGMDGLSLLRVLRERVPDVDVVVMTAFDEMPIIVQAMRDGAFEFIVKPLRLADLRGTLARLVEDRRTREAGRRARESEADAYRLDALVGRHPRMIEVYKRVGQLAASRVNALIRGETGSGKGMVARAIHYNSPDASHPFIAVNCTALPETLLESELFGHVRGSFTGAVSDRKGRFALAGRGTIFLDEVGDTTPEFQAKLLKVIEDKEYHPVGSERAERTEARVIAATHRDLEDKVEHGLFRQDLYYRLRVVEVTLPPLRERPDDIPLLAMHFLRKASLELHRPELQLADDALAALMQHAWTGNVRELENCITRAAVLATGGTIRPENLGLHGREPDATRGFPTLEALETEHVARALALTQGNRTRAAEILGISKPRLYRCIEKYGLQ
jgi:two-component system, NtrC family, response regulator AtoC